MLLCCLALASACDDGTAAPPIDPNDVDGDGIANEQDLCPTAHDPAQHDEDGDGVGDRCDVCPTVVDPMQADTGEVNSIAFEDGIGDACDPRPARGGDKIGALHTFVAESPSAWIGAGWTVEGDRARASAAARWLHRTPQPGDSLAARLAIETLAWTSTHGAVAVAADGDGLENARSCTLLQDRDGDGNDELEARELGGAFEVRELAGQVSGRVELIVHRGVDTRAGTGTVHCRIRFLDEQGTTASEVAVQIRTGDAFTTGQYVFSAEEADVVATSLVVYKSPIGCMNASAAACPGPPPP